MPVNINNIINKHIVIWDFTEVTPNPGLERGNGYMYQGCAYPCPYKDEQDIQVSVKGFTKQ